MPSQSKVRIATLAGFLTALMLTVSACGANTKVEVVRLRSASPFTSDLYVRVWGPAGAISYITQGLTRGAFGRVSGGYFVPPSLRVQKACSFSHVIGYADPPNFQAWRGRKVTITVYGNPAYAATYCLGIRAGIFESPS